MSTHREDGQSVIFAEVHRSEESSDGDEYEQAVAVGGRCEKLDAARQCNDTDEGVAATIGTQRGLPLVILHLRMM